MGQVFELKSIKLVQIMSSGEAKEAEAISKGILGESCTLGGKDI